MIGVNGILGAGYRAKSEKSEGPKEMTSVNCSDCGQTTQVPFKPSAGRPVYCRNCFVKHKPKDR
jgi:CxxC-x17-CxxC domain-containing protein